MQPFANFHRDKTTLLGIAYWCKPCANRNARKNNLKNKDNLEYRKQKKNNYIKNRHGITLQEYNAKLAEQDFVCAICGVELSEGDPNTHLDHCHKSGKLRAFLCTNCNRGLGHFKDSIDNLQKAVDYLNSHSEYENSQKGYSQ